MNWVQNLELSHSTLVNLSIRPTLIPHMKPGCPKGSTPTVIRGGLVVCGSQLNEIRTAPNQFT